MLANRGWNGSVSNAAAGLAKRVGLLGGAFDPPHEGHLKLAQIAWDHLKLDELRFVPAFMAPQKQEPSASSDMRVAMLREMISGTPFIIDEIELGQEEVSYTVKTLEALSKNEPGAAWILIMGSDQAANFESWRGRERILELASVSIAQRPDLHSNVNDGLMACAGTAKARPQGILPASLSDCWSGAPGEAVLLPSTGLTAASSQIRGQLACGSEPSGLSERVKSVIAREKLYH